MPSSLLFPLEKINPSQLLSQYSEWIYFTLILVFFISVSGITLRRHFDKPYVKPLIISVGLMLTVGVFMFKDRIRMIFEGWGILGTILLLIVAVTIPFGLCRSFGLSTSKAFFLTYVLFYLLSWTKFPQFYHSLSDQNLGFINLFLLILFFVAVFKVIKFHKSASDMVRDLDRSSPYRSEIEQEIEMLDKEKKIFKRQAKRFTKIEIKTIDDIAQALADIQHTVETHKNNLPREERERIAHILQLVSKKENVFNKSIWSLQKIFKSTDLLDEKQLQELKERMAKVSGSERKFLKAEIMREDEKLKIEKPVLDFQNKLEDYLNYFNKLLGMALKLINTGTYPYDAKPHLAKARVILKDITNLLKEMKVLEKRLISLTKAEKRLLKKEREIA
jgi:hypothetical protein